MSKNVFLDLGFSEDEAAGLKLRSYLFMALQEIIRKSGMSQVKIAEIMGADQPKVSKILNGNSSEFSIERITEYLQRLGYDIGSILLSMISALWAGEQCTAGRQTVLTSTYHLHPERFVNGQPKPLTPAPLKLRSLPYA